MEAGEPVTDREDGESAVERVYEHVKAMAISFEFRPGSRVNELAIARKIGVSRTPLREALNRLTADGFLTFSPKQGFFRKPLSVQEITDLYELREQMERGVARLAAERATDEDLDRLEAFLDHTGDSSGKTASAVLDLDEQFHEQLAAMTGNGEIMHSLKNVNDRIRFVRWVNMDGRRDHTQGEHRAILAALRQRDAAGVEALIAGHIMMRQDQIVQSVRDAFARIYMDDGGAPKGM
jgi:DNA-binding GntR family transcriptional regulator